MAKVIAVSRSSSHSFAKTNRDEIKLLTGLGVEDDAHLGQTVQHRSRIAIDPTQPNLRQVHFIHQELFEELNRLGYRVLPGELGENITTEGIDLLSLPTGTKLRLGSEVIVEITGLRNPCKQLDGFQEGLMNAVLDRDEKGQLVRKAGVMGIVAMGGTVKPGDAIEIVLPQIPHQPLAPV